MTLTAVTYRRQATEAIPAITYVATVGGYPYHVIPGDPLYPLAAMLGADAPFDPMDPIIPPLTLAQRRAGMNLTKLQLAIMAQRPGYGFMTTAEAEAWLGPGTIPAVAQAVLDGITDQAARNEATLRFVGATNFSRLDPFILLLKSALALSDTVMDAFFTEGAAL